MLNRSVLLGIGESFSLQWVDTIHSAFTMLTNLLIHGTICFVLNLQKQVTMPKKAKVTTTALPENSC